ncbi:carbohydrate ABC transporter permease [Thermus thermophilus]|uniref:ABC-type transporter, integral membrane subunit n=2 Tax=Thermus thermophilus TaxID=274 RepID=F6DJP8_THETG|nr:sugar ABC transporter permease [Thermus thermophilus]AEG34645.1 ABC-type transporter, integral membrane subunit [Thermus thermophilus SG0.5JP17-16]NHK39547.1 sugar ABC transporter permease [Thermus thermophilus]BBL83479.1 trehalose/maltose ABC transporter permease [Thermus thermophilus]BBL85747.1 trehalose/maltose ABC transporter permease [Thermus thermophilus]BCZ88160.1 trehalose/maltose ABC transporter permease [Thermus thermophilus]
MRTFWRKYGLAYLFIAPAFLGMLLVHYGPMVQGIYMGFLDLRLQTLRLYLQAPFVGLENYREILLNPESTFRAGFLYAVRTTLLYTLVVNALNLSLGLLVAHLLNRPLFLRGLWRSLILLPWVVPSYVVGLLWGFMWLKEGVINHLLVDVLGLLPQKPHWLIGPLTFVAIVLPTVWRSWPFVMVTYLAALQTVPQELYEAAKVDGATPWQRFRFVTWPMLRPVTAVLLLYGLLGTMYSFNIVYMMFGHGAGYPGEWGDLLMTNLFRNTFGMWNFGLGAAASTLYMLLSLGLILFWYRVFREDLRAR